jgi:hypothetical protein
LGRGNVDLNRATEGQKRLQRYDGGQHVEVTTLAGEDARHVRSIATAEPSDAVLAFALGTWQAFISHLKSGAADFAYLLPGGRSASQEVLRARHPSPRALLRN